MVVDPGKHLETRVISIDTSRVPPEKLSRHDFVDLKTQMESALAKPAWIKAFCIHEAGHMTYFRQLGIAEYEFAGPRIKYNPKTDSFDGYMASVKPKAPPTSADLRTAAKAYVAGLVFTRRLTNAPDSGEQEDRQNFDAVCQAIEHSLNGLTIDRDESWKEAEKDVVVDLRSPQFRTKAWETAREIEKILFDS